MSDNITHLFGKLSLQKYSDFSEWKHGHQKLFEHLIGLSNKFLIYLKFEIIKLDQNLLEMKQKNMN